MLLDVLLHAVRDAGVWNRQSEPCVGTNKQQTNKNKTKCVGMPVSPSECCRRDAATSRRSKRGRTDPEMAVTSSATNV